MDDKENNDLEWERFKAVRSIVIASILFMIGGFVFLTVYLFGG